MFTIGFFDFFLDNFLLNPEFLLGAMVTALVLTLFNKTKERLKKPKKIDYMLVYGFLLFFIIDQSHRSWIPDWMVTYAWINVAFILSYYLIRGYNGSRKS